MDMKKHNSIVTDIEMVNKEGECCFSCAQIFEEDDFILAAYGLLFCSIDCVQKKFPDIDLGDVEIILASDIGVK
jgi:hypothetical protein